MSSRLKESADSIREIKNVRPGKETELEKGDFRALTAAAYAVYGKALLIVLAVFVLALLLLGALWN